MYKFLGTYQVVPKLPEKLESLRDLAYNLHWTWNIESQSLFRRLDRELWEDTNHNPILLLGKVSQERLEEISNDEGFLSHLKRAYNSLQVYLSGQTWFNKNYKNGKDFHIVYFSAEYGLSECLQTYSGGLGVLAGDHLKAASDLGIPLIGIGLLYKEGYFQQYLTSDGWQHERYEINDFENLPMKLVLNGDNKALLLSIDFPGRKVYFQIWKIQIGRIPLYLLDTNVVENSVADRKITETLYGGNIETRIQQEIILGIGGIRTMYALGIDPTVCHMNEGHSAFLSLERIRNLIQKEKLSFSEAKEVGFYSNIFTTHTPVPAGIDVFSNELVEKYFGDYYRNELMISDKEFYALGNINLDKHSNIFNMAHLAVNMSGFVNGVSKLHSQVARKMWGSGFKDIPFNEIPIDSITNGVHTRSHISKEMEDLFIQYIGESWVNDISSTSLWEKIDKIPDEELWRTHEKRRERLVAFARRRLVKQIKEKGGNQNEIQQALEVLDPSVLTIGFSRRFAAYKRANLIFHDIDRLETILNNLNYPVQIIFAGKAHPKDEEGKRIIQEIYQIANEERFRKKIVFIENYDMNVARHLVEGCDIWLNNPRRPLEASGTSGMKVIVNGGLNFSVLDGWWDEAYSPELGWKIGNGEEYTDEDYHDEVEARLLYNILEKEIIPLFYNRIDDKLPRKWIMMIKNSMKKLGPYFNTHRMVKEYFENYYYSAYQKNINLRKNNFEVVKNLTQWKEEIIKNWEQIKIENISTMKNGLETYVGDNYSVNAEVFLGKLSPDDVEVQIYYGLIDKQDDPFAFKTSPMRVVNKKQNGNMIYKYVGSINCNETGLFAFTIRILPKHNLMVNPFELGKVFWAN
ncbi:MAG: glycosyltransferase family 1 protein [Ignavibacterium sp.]